MVQCSMDFFDVVFPLNIGPLTYCRSSDQGQLSPGMIVRAEVKKSVRHGIVLGKAVHPPEGHIKKITEAMSGEVRVSGSFLRLLKWMAEYYLVPEGAVLKSAALMEYLRPAKPGNTRTKRPGSPGPAREALQLPAVSHRALAPVCDSLSRREYGTYLLHAPSLSFEISALLTVMDGLRNIVILVPEIAQIGLLSQALGDSCGSRLAILHGRLSKRERRNVLARILSGESDIVLGSRIAATAPLPTVALFAVLQEQNDSYKNLEGVRYHARDVAVMRGYLEKSTVLLSSTCPSVESFFNAEKGKYHLITAAEEAARPRVEVVNMKTSGKATPHLSRRVLRAVSDAIKKQESVLFFVNRKGYSLIQCEECDYVFRCPECGIPLIYHKDKHLLRCHYCNHSSRAPEACGKCGSIRLESVGAGTQRVASEIEKHFGIEPVRIDKDTLRDEPGLNALSGGAHGEEVIVGTKALSGRLLRAEGHSLCVFLNPDISLHVPDFRSSELLFREIIGMSEHLRPEGLIIIQTKMPESYVFRCARGYRFREFFLEELSMRRSLAYPPLSRMIVITLSASHDSGKTFVDAFPRTDEKIEIMGPLPLHRKGIYTWKFVLKSASKTRLTQYARTVLEALRKETKVRVAVEVDPIAI
ncbi:MAG: primosomal protein N' [Nitrospirae bacterium]|nr:primosomal protein N' [Nitrospirota bacterium]